MCFKAVTVEQFHTCANYVDMRLNMIMKICAADLFVDTDLAGAIVTSVATVFILGGHCSAATTAICIIEGVFTAHSAIGMQILEPCLYCP